MPNMKWKILISAPYFQDAYEQYKDRLLELGIDAYLPKVAERMGEDELLDIIHDFDGIISGDDAFTRKVLEQCKKLKVISKWGTGIDSIDKESAAELGIAVRNTPGAFSDPVADTVIAFILAFTRGIHRQDADIRNGIWKKRTCIALKGLTLGVVGVGDCGKAVVRRAKGFGMRLLGNDIRTIDPEFVSETGIEMTDLDRLLSEADFVSVNCDLNPTSFHLLDAKRFSMMKPTAYYITTCRGPVTKEIDLVEALRSEKIAGAGVDVFEDEPLPEISPLRELPNVLLSPHNANSDPATAQRIHEKTLSNLLEELEKHTEK